MNTQAHALVNYLLQRKRTEKRLHWVIFLGAILPDLPMLVFYGWEKFVLGTPERIIWSQKYFTSFWQTFIDCFNSIPFIGLMIGIGYWRRIPLLQVLGIGMILHVLCDLPLHHDDGHRHFFPLSDFRFASPVSYWDPSHFGGIVGPLEIVGYTIGAVWLWRQVESRLAKVGLALGGVLYLATFLHFVSV